MKKSTKQKIIEAALVLFGESGYAGASLRDICAKAGVNNAAVNYHFKDKRGLYKAVLTSLMQKSEALCHQCLEGPPEERLRQVVETALRDIFRDRGDHKEKLVFREIAEPTEELLEILRGPLSALFHRLLEVVNELSPQSGEKKSHLIVLSIFGQIDYYRVFYRFIPELIGKDATDELSLELISAHITEFSLAAISKLD